MTLLAGIRLVFGPESRRGLSKILRVLAGRVAANPIVCRALLGFVMSGEYIRVSTTDLWERPALTISNVSKPGAEGATPPGIAQAKGPQVHVLTLESG